jgi:hypothetical protein
MTRTRLAAFLALAALLSNGCGSICNVVCKDPDVYGGVQKDIAATQHIHNGGKIGLFVLGIIGADTCLSAAGDTLTLPLVVYRRQKLPATDTPFYSVFGSGDAVDSASPAAAENTPRQPCPICVYQEENGPSQWVGWTFIDSAPRKAAVGCDPTPLDETQTGYMEE